jgi:hypothetical protein
LSIEYGGVFTLTGGDPIPQETVTKTFAGGRELDDPNRIECTIDFYGKVPGEGTFVGYGEAIAVLVR